MDKLDQIALQILCADLHRNGQLDITSKIRSAYHCAGLMIRFREKHEEELKSQAEKALRQENGDIRGNREITIRTQNALWCSDIYSFDDLTQWTEYELLRLPNLGRKALNEIKEQMAIRGLSLKNEKAK